MVRSGLRAFSVYLRAIYGRFSITSRRSANRSLVVRFTPTCTQIPGGKCNRKCNRSGNILTERVVCAGQRHRLAVRIGAVKRQFRQNSEGARTSSSLGCV